jgi:mono/diheme cytochrome c family protein
MRHLFLLLSASLALVVPCASTARAQASSAPEPERTGEQIYQAACAACHGPDGKGQPQAVLGFEPPPTFPDFTDCAVSSPEPDLIWLAVVHWGGRARGESHRMPAFEDTLTDAEIDRVVQHLHSLCAEPNWPRGNLNFARAFFTEKAFPENETIFTVTADRSHPNSVVTRVDYERRIGRRAQFEFGAPLNFQQSESGDTWTKGLGDINAAYRYTFYDNLRTRSIFAAGAEVTLPTGKENEGLGGGVTIFETFAMMDQGLPGNGFVQIHTGFERPKDHAVAPNAFYWRTAVGKTFAQHRWGRTWSPILEVLADKDLEDGAKTKWDVVPQMQVSLSVFQHVLLSVGMRVPVNERDTRGNAFMTYFLWDWFDGPLFQLWRAH